MGKVPIVRFIIWIKPPKSKPTYSAQGALSLPLARGKRKTGIIPGV